CLIFSLCSSVSLCHGGRFHFDLMRMEKASSTQQDNTEIVDQAGSRNGSQASMATLTGGSESLPVPIVNLIRLAIGVESADPALDVRSLQAPKIRVLPVGPFRLECPTFIRVGHFLFAL